jgi:transmembrane sensor
MGVAAAARVFHVRAHARPINPAFSVWVAASARPRLGSGPNGIAPPPNATETAAAPDAPSSASPLVQAKSPTSSWKDWAQRGQNAKAYAELGPGGIERAAQAAAVGDLLVLADVARLSGHPTEAVNPLERVVQEHAGDSRAPLAAFMLGRVELDSLGAPAAGARAFQRAIALGIPGGLAEDAYAGMIESRARAGERSGARAAYAEYLAKYPLGRRGKEMQRWIAEP